MDYLSITMRFGNDLSLLLGGWGSGGRSGTAVIWQLLDVLLTSVLCTARLNIAGSLRLSDRVMISCYRRFFGVVFDVVFPPVSRASLRSAVFATSKRAPVGFCLPVLQTAFIEVAGADQGDQERAFALCYRVLERSNNEKRKKQDSSWINLFCRFFFVALNIYRQQ